MTTQSPIVARKHRHGGFLSSGATLESERPAGAVSLPQKQKKPERLRAGGSFKQIIWF